VLDEAHKYLVNSDSARLTQSVSNIIRLQRHLATRVIIATQEPTVIPVTILDLASIIICHRFSSPAWCAHLARHVSTGNESASWYHQVMSLATGDALVFSPAAVITADEHGVVLLGRDHLKMRVRPRLTLDGGASLLAVGRSLPTLPSIPPLSLPTPPTLESYIPAHTETHLEYTSTAPSQAAAHLPVTATPFASPSAGLAPFATSAIQITAPARRTVPARLKHLVGWLQRNKAADTAVKLGDAASGLYWVGKKDVVYAGMKGRQWWTYMLDEAVENGLIEVINKDVSKKELKARGEEKMIRLLERGPLVYV
jgi:hypothetical protein